jgi:RNA polymerase sigma-70 factor (ECF subfamily)
VSTDHQNPDSAGSGAGGVFATTHWTVVLAAGQSGSPDAGAALDQLCRLYWYPLFAYARRQGHSREDAEDLTQGFFARLLEKNYLEGVTSEKGRFRSFLLMALKRYMANEWDRANAQKRGGGARPLSLDWQDAESRYQINPADTLSPDRLFDRAWAVVILERVITRLRDECGTDGEGGQYERLKPFLMLGRGEIPYVQAAADLKMSEGAVRVAVHRLRRRYRELLREEIARTLANPAQADEEMRALFAALAGT